MRQALRSARGEFGREYELQIPGARLKTEEKLPSLNPSHPGEVVGLHQKETPALARMAVESALAFYPERIEENIRRMIAVAGDAGRLRPHMKTHKTGEIVKLQLKHGIRRFKYSTIAEMEMAAAAGAPDVLLAMQPVGPAIPRFVALQRAFPGTFFSAIVDSEEVIRAIARAAAGAGTTACLWLDVNSGMNRTGVAPGAGAGHLYRLIHQTAGLTAGGVHVYDGHIHASDVAARTKQSRNRCTRPPS